jgi:hypothetical protein
MDLLINKEKEAISTLIRKIVQSDTDVSKCIRSSLFEINLQSTGINEKYSQL